MHPRAPLPRAAQPRRPGTQAAAEEAWKLSDRRYTHADERVAAARDELAAAQADRDEALPRYRDRQAYLRAVARVERARQRVEEFQRRRRMGLGERSA